MPKRVAVGVVTSDKMTKTRRVEIARLIKDPLYGKIVKRKTVCLVHDEENSSQLGDTVEVIESRPRSKRKRWELVRIVKKSEAVDIIAARQAAKSRRREEASEQE